MRYTLFLALLLAPWLIACDTSDDDDQAQRPDRGTAQVRYIHAASSLDSIDIYSEYYNVRAAMLLGVVPGDIDPQDGYLTQEATRASDAETNFPGFQLLVHDAEDSATIFDKVNLIPPTSLQFNRDQRYSVFLVDSDGSATFTNVRDAEFSYEADTVSNIRFVNVSSQQGLSARWVRGGFNGTTDSPASGNASPYLALVNGTYTLQVWNGSSPLASFDNIVLDRSTVTVYYADGGNGWYYQER